MTILLVAPWDEKLGGVVSVAGNLATYLERQGHRVLFLHPGESDRGRFQRTKWGFPGYRLKLRAPFNPACPIRSMVAFALTLPWTLFQLHRIARRHRVDLVNVHYPMDAFVALGILRALFGRKLVVSVHGSDLLSRGQPRPRYPWGVRLLLRVADRLIAPSQAYRRGVVAIFPLMRAKTQVIHNGINLADFASPVAVRDLPQAPYLLCVAAHNPVKGLEVLLRAFHRVHRRRPSLRLVLVGDGPQRPQLEELARTLGVDRSVHFLGVRDKPEISALLRGCELFVLPSLSEAFGIAVIEALACGAPVVASRVGGIPEIIQHGVNGWLVEPGSDTRLADALIRLADDPVARADLAATGRTTVERRFLWDHCGAAYERVMTGLLHGEVSVAPLREPTPSEPAHRLAAVDTDLEPTPSLADLAG